MKPPFFIECFIDYCKGTPTPELFAKWGAIACLSGAMERRVWALTKNTQLFPNTFILLVAPPAVGKSRVLNDVHQLWGEVPGFNVAPASMTRAALVDALNSVLRTKMEPGTTKIFDYHALLVVAPEFGVLVESHDLGFMNVLIDLYDCRKNYVERRRTLKDVIDISRPCLSMIGGTQPAYLGQLLPEAAYGMGFTSRCIFVYQNQGPQIPIFENKAIERGDMEKALIRHLLQVADAYGQMTWTEQAQVAIQSWVSEGMPPVPDHYRLRNYSARRDLHLLKLCLIGAMGRLSMEVSLSDFLWAKDTLLEAERFMPDIFRDMMAGPDSQIIAETVSFIKMLYARDQKPIAESRIVNFLSQKIPTDRIIGLLSTMVKADILDMTPMPSGLRMYSPPKPVPLTGFGETK